MVIDNEKLQKWDKYIFDKPELKEIIGELAISILELKARIESLERMEFGK